MNPELQNYIRQARAIGKSNEIITQELSSGGWTPSDISQALGLGTVAPITATTSVVAGVMGGKIIAGIVVGLIVVGGGGVFVWNKMQENTLEVQLENQLEQVYGGNADVKVGNNFSDIQIKTDTGSFSSSGDVGSMPAGWPSEIPQYPNSKIGTSVNNSANGSTQLIVALTTQDNPEQVIEYYKPRFSSNGWTNIKTESFSGTFVVSGEKNGHLMAINANNASGETRIGMIYRNK